MTLSCTEHTVVLIIPATIYNFTSSLILWRIADVSRHAENCRNI